MFPHRFARKNMKKPLLAMLGLAGACAACCAIPVVLTLVSSLSLAGVVALIMGSQTAQIGVAALAAVLLVGLAAWKWGRASAARDHLPPSSCARGPAAGSCCAPATGKAGP
jgi:hypothetical protein